MMRKGDIFIGHPERPLAERHMIEVRRVAKDGSWADIKVQTWACMWTKRQPLVEGAFAFPSEPWDWSYLFFADQEADHMAMLREREVS
jgi:hypothetical protein